MFRRNELWLSLALLLLAGAPARADDLALRAELLAAAQVAPDRLREWQRTGGNAIVLEITGDAPDRERQAADLVLAAGLPLHYWVEVGRCVPLADEHPEWMSSLQGHTEWRRFHPDFPQPRAGEIVKAHPWVPVLYREAFDAHLARLDKLLAGLPASRGLFLNDLQGGPSACGCGHPLCRWTTDYGPLRSAEPLGDDAAARFVAAVKMRLPNCEVIPVWTTECEEHDGARDGLCAGVGCFRGICWKAYTRQLAPVAAASQRLAVQLYYRSLQRDLPTYGRDAGWVSWALQSFQAMPPQHGGRPIAAARLLAVLQGWDVTPEQIAAQIERAESAGAGGYVVARCRVEQGWSPRIVKIP